MSMVIKMTAKTGGAKFKEYEQYVSYYSSATEKSATAKKKYYHIGEQLAKMAAEKAIESIGTDTK